MRLIVSVCISHEEFVALALTEVFAIVSGCAVEIVDIVVSIEHCVLELATADFSTTEAVYDACLVRITGSFANNRMLWTFKMLCHVAL